jgi:hypothetical protein
MSNVNELKILAAPYRNIQKRLWTNNMDTDWVLTTSNPPSTQSLTGSTVRPQCCSGTLRSSTLARAQTLQTGALLIYTDSTHAELHVTAKLVKGKVVLVLK